MAATRPYVSFAEVRQKVSLPDVLEKLGILDQFTVSADRCKLKGCCPLHQHGPHPNPEAFKADNGLGVWVYNCFGDCAHSPEGGGGDVVTFVKRYKGYTYSHTRFWFAEAFGEVLDLKPPGTKTKTKKTAKQTPAPAVAPADNGKPPSRSPPPPRPAVKDQKQPARGQGTAKPLKALRFFLDLERDVPYLNERGIRRETIDRYGIGLCVKKPDKARYFDGYVACPVVMPGVGTVAYLGRLAGEDANDTDRPRYKWPKDTPKHKLLVGLPQALEGTGRKPLILVEGIFGMFHLFQCGFPTGVAVVGCSLSDDQAELLASYKRGIVLLFDGDEAGQAGQRQAAGKLITRTWVRAIKLPAGKQPDDMKPEELQELLHFMR